MTERPSGETVVLDELRCPHCDEPLADAFPRGAFVIKGGGAVPLLDDAKRIMDDMHESLCGYEARIEELKVENERLRRLASQVAAGCVWAIQGRSDVPADVAARIRGEAGRVGDDPEVPEV